MIAAGRLETVARTFGPGAERRKASLLREIADRWQALPPREQRSLAAGLGLLLAYPDSPRILRAAKEIAKRMPEVGRTYPFSLGVVRRLDAILPGKVEIAWRSLERDEPLTEALYLLVSRAESYGLEEIRLTLEEWMCLSRPDPSMNGIAFLISLLESSDLPAPVREFLYDNAQVPVRWRGPGSCRISLPVRRIHYQRQPPDRKPFPLPPIIRRPLDRVRRGGGEVLDACLLALCARKLEIYPLTHANPADVTLVEGRRGLMVALAGVRPEWRGALEALCFFMIFKNGVPVAYGPARALAGCCEMGINLFPEYRGGEIRHIYALLLRVLHHLLGVDYFFLTSYGMGENNEAAVRTGAFWFYRRLGFRPTSPAVEALALAEERKMREDPAYRSDRRTLRRLSHTDAYLDLSGGRRRPLDLGRIGTALTRFVGRSFGGDRGRAERVCTDRIGRQLGLRSAGPSARCLAALLCLVPGLNCWPRRDRSALVAFLKAKDAPSEMRAARLLARHRRLCSALHAVGGSGGGDHATGFSRRSRSLA